MLKAGQNRAREKGELGTEAYCVTFSLAEVLWAMRMMMCMWGGGR